MISFNFIGGNFFFLWLDQGLDNLDLYAIKMPENAPHLRKSPLFFWTLNEHENCRSLFGTTLWIQKSKQRNIGKFEV